MSDGLAGPGGASPHMTRNVAGSAASPSGSAGPDPLMAFCRSLPGATEDVKWGHDLVFSVGAKMFAGFQLPDGQPLAFKVDPLVYASLAHQPGFAPAPYMARHHWVSVADRTAVPEAVLQDLLAESHRLVAARLPRKTRQALGLS